MKPRSDLARIERAIAVARLFRGGGLESTRAKTLASEEASYSNNEYRNNEWNLEIL